MYINYNGNLMVDQIPIQSLVFFGTIGGSNLPRICGSTRYNVDTRSCCTPRENEQLKWARWLEKEQHLFARWWWLWFQIFVSLDSYLKNDVVWPSIIFQQGWNQLVSYPTSWWTLCFTTAQVLKYFEPCNLSRTPCVFGYLHVKNTRYLLEVCVFE